MYKHHLLTVDWQSIDVFIAKDLPICQMAVNLAANGSTVKTVVQQVLGDDMYIYFYD